MILSLIYQTIIIILLLSFSFGPSFFALINTGIKYGYKTGSLLAVGILLSDFLVCLLIIILVDLGAANLIDNEKNQRFMGIMAGLVLLVFGVLYFREPLSRKNESIDIVLPSAGAMLIKGFLLNLLNPAVWLLWLGNVTAVSKSLNYSIVNMILYFGLTLGLVLMVELAKVSAANRLKKILTQKTMHLIHNITGVLLIIFGLILIYNHYFELT
ncbi:MAG TPA: LysE family transporter [Bacteroidia bacterium]|nr:LysE family transporter [Bacteroidia bacterium]